MNAKLSEYTIHNNEDNQETNNDLIKSYKFIPICDVELWDDFYQNLPVDC